MNLVITEKSKIKKQRCELCNVCPANMERHNSTKRHLNNLNRNKDGDSIKEAIRTILVNREDLLCANINEIIADCDKTDSHDVFVTKTIVEFLESLQRQEANKFTVTDETVAIIPDQEI